MLRFVTLALLGLAVANATLLGGGLLGGFSEVDKDDDRVQGVVSFVEAQLNAQSNDMYRSRVSNVISVQQQVVNGINYMIEFEFARTMCSKMSMITLESCPMSKQTQICTAKVHLPIGGEPILSDFGCKQGEGMERRAGGISGPVENPEAYRNHAIRALGVSNSLLDATNFRVVEVRTQTVAGQMIYMKVQGKDVKGVETLCDMTIWSRVWITGPLGYQVMANKCKPVKVQKRTVLGGGGSCPGCVSEEMPVDAGVQALFLDLLDASNSNLDASSVKFVSMTRQVVAGMKYVVKVQSQQNGKPVVCTFTIVDQPWMTPSSTMSNGSCLSA